MPTLATSPRRRTSRAHAVATAPFRGWRSNDGAQPEAVKATTARNGMGRCARYGRVYGTCFLGQGEKDHILRNFLSEPTPQQHLMEASPNGVSMQRPWTRLLRPAAIALCASVPAFAHAQGFSYSLAGGNDGWPPGARTAIQDAMDEAAAQYIAEGYFDKHDTANYRAGVPTAQSNYDGWIDFGGSINARVALHEIAHTMGVGTYWGFGGGPWSPGPDSAAGRLIQLYEGQGAIINTGGTHFWPYGLNYDSEDNPEARVRHVRLISAMRFDMGIVKDSDSDGLRDDWELHFFGGLDEAAAGDPDQDGITNADEQASDSDPKTACPLVDGHTYVVRSQRADVVVTASGAAAVLRAASSSDAQRFTAHYVGGGFFKLTSASGLVLGMPGTDTGNGIDVELSAEAQALRQQWRVTKAPGADTGYFALSNRETARVLDGGDATDGSVTHQWALIGNLSQQFWRFEDQADADSGSDAGTGGDASTGNDMGAADASAPTGAGDGGTSAGSDGGAFATVDGGTAASVDAGSGQAGGSNSTDDEPRKGNHGCALAAPRSAPEHAPALFALVALTGLMARRRRR
jgi:Ricin-type beta-trefoil lectin domain-like